MSTNGPKRAVPKEADKIKWTKTMNFGLALIVEHQKEQKKAKMVPNWAAILTVFNHVFGPDLSASLPHGLQEPGKLRSQYSDRARGRTDAWDLKKDSCSNEEIAEMDAVATAVIATETTLSTQPQSIVQYPGNSPLRWIFYKVEEDGKDAVQKEQEQESNLPVAEARDYAEEELSDNDANSTTGCHGLVTEVATFVWLKSIPFDELLEVTKEMKPGMYDWVDEASLEEIVGALLASEQRRIYERIEQCDLDQNQSARLQERVATTYALSFPLSLGDSKNTMLTFLGSVCAYYDQANGIPMIHTRFVNFSGILPSIQRMTNDDNMFIDNNSDIFFCAGEVRRIKFGAPNTTRSECADCTLCDMNVCHLCNPDVDQSLLSVAQLNLQPLQEVLPLVHCKDLKELKNRALLYAPIGQSAVTIVAPVAGVQGVCEVKFTREKTVKVMACNSALCTLCPSPSAKDD